MNLSVTIPQLFYDIIGRIIPGSILLLSTIMILLGPKEGTIIIIQILTFGPLKHLSIFLLICLWILLSYFISIIIAGCWEILCKRFKKVNSMFMQISQEISSFNTNEVLEDFLKHKNINRELNKLKEKKNLEDTKTDSLFPTIAFMYDFIRINAPDIGTRVVKVRAECHMCKILSLGWSILFFIGMLHSIFLKDIGRLIFTFSLLILIACSFSLMKKLESRFKKALYDHWLLLISKLELE